MVEWMTACYSNFATQKRSMQKFLSLLLLLMLCVTLLPAQVSKVTLSGMVKESNSKAGLSFVNITLKKSSDSSFIAGTITNEEGRFSFTDIKTGEYILQS